jgi:hypothetical protein
MQPQQQQQQQQRFDLLSVSTQKKAAVLAAAATVLFAAERSTKTPLFRRLASSWPPNVRDIGKYGPVVAVAFVVPIVFRAAQSFKPLEANEAQKQWHADEMQKRRAVLRNLLHLAYKLARAPSRERMTSLLRMVGGGVELRSMEQQIAVQSGESQEADRHEEQQQWERRLEAEVKYSDVRKALVELQEGLAPGEHDGLVAAGYMVAAVLLSNDLDFTTTETTLAYNAKTTTDADAGAGTDERRGTDGEEANEKYRDGKELERLVLRTERIDEFLRSSSLDFGLGIIDLSSIGGSEFAPTERPAIRAARAEYWEAWCRAQKLVDAMSWHKYAKAGALLLQAKRQVPFIVGASVFSVLMGVLRSTHLYYESLLVKTVKDQSVSMGMGMGIGAGVGAGVGAAAGALTFAEVLRGLMVMQLVVVLGKQLQRQLSEMGSKALSTTIKRRIFLAILSQDIQFFEENNVRQLFSISESVVSASARASVPISATIWC